MDSRIKELALRYAAECREEAIELLRTLGRIPAPSHHEGLRTAYIRS